jgi:hypothetical protein
VREPLRVRVADEQHAASLARRLNGHACRYALVSVVTGGSLPSPSGLRAELEAILQFADECRPRAAPGRPTLVR